MDNNAAIGQNFLELPQPHHHVSKLMVLTIILAVIVIVAASYAAYTSVNKVEVQPQNIQHDVAADDNATKMKQASQALQQFQSTNVATEKDMLKAAAQIKDAKPATEEQMKAAARSLNN